MSSGEGHEPDIRALWLGPLRPHAAGALVFGGALVALGVARGALWLVALTLAVLAVYAAMVVPRSLRRRALLRAPFPAEDRAFLERRVRFYRGLDAPGRARFERHVCLALADYRFEAVDGARLDVERCGDATRPVRDEVRLLAAAAAATLAHGAARWPFRGERTILVYPDHFDAAYRVAADHDVAGMVHAQGPIVLSRRALRDGYLRERDGYNVALHELAHELDMDDGHADGVPIGLSSRAYGPWLALMQDRMRRARRHASVLRDYAGTNEAETFAVAVELFFERPDRLAARDPELYGALRAYFGLDPAPIVKEGGSRRP